MKLVYAYTLFFDQFHRKQDFIFYFIFNLGLEFALLKPAESSNVIFFVYYSQSTLN